MSRLQNLRKNNTKAVYSRTEEEKVPRSFNLLTWFIIIIGLGALSYLVVFSGAFTIGKVDVSGYEHPETIIDIVEAQKGENLLSGNLLFFNKNKLESTIAGDKRIKELTVKKIIPNKLRIQVVVTNPAIIWNTAGEEYILDDRGVVTARKTDEVLPVVFDASNIKVEEGERVASPTFIKFIKDVTGSFKAITGSEIIKITIFDILTDVHVLSSDRWTVYLDASKDPEAQLKNLARVLGEALKEKRKLEYIDMRFDNRIFYK